MLYRSGTYDKIHNMEIQEIKESNVDWAILPCVAPDWEDKMQKGMALRQTWLKKMLKKGLRVLVALKEVKGRKIPVGLVEYLPIEIAPEPVQGKDLIFIDCIWIIPRFWHQGIAAKLMDALIKRTCGVTKGIAVLAYESDKWFNYFDYMPAEFFKKFKFEAVAKDDSRVLLELRFKKGESPHILSPKSDLPTEATLSIFWNSQCPWSYWMLGTVKKRIHKYPDIRLNAINTDKRTTIEKYGIAKGVFINGKLVYKRLASWKEIEKAIPNNVLTTGEHGNY